MCNYIVISYLSFFFFNDTSTTDIYPLSLHDALPIWFPSETSFPLRTLYRRPDALAHVRRARRVHELRHHLLGPFLQVRSEEHTSELQSQFHLVCRLLLEKKKIKKFLLLTIIYIISNN